MRWPRSTDAAGGPLGPRFSDVKNERSCGRSTIHGSLGTGMVAGSGTGGPGLGRIVGFEPGNAATKEGVVWAFPPAMCVSGRQSGDETGVSRLFSLVSDLLRS